MIVLIPIAIGIIAYPDFRRASVFSQIRQLDGIVQTKAMPDAGWLTQRIGKWKPDAASMAWTVHLSPKSLEPFLRNPDLFANTRELGLSGAGIDDSSLARLKTLPQLETLSFVGTSVTGRGLTAFESCHELKYLDLRGLNVGDDPLHALTSFRNLTELNLASPATDACMQSVAQLHNLETLSLIGTRVSDLGLAQLTTLRNLRVLLLNDMQISDAGLSVVSSMPNLRYLSLKNTAVTDVGMRHIAAIPTLTTLRLQGTRITDDGVAQLAQLRSLETLALGNTRITDRSLKMIGQLTSLQTLSLSDTGVTDVGMSHLKDLKVLETISLDRTAVTDAGIEEIARLPGVLSMGVNGTKVTSAMIKVLDQMPREKLRRSGRSATK